MPLLLHLLIRCHQRETGREIRRIRLPCSSTKLSGTTVSTIGGERERVIEGVVGADFAIERVIGPNRLVDLFIMIMS